jgi:hypothetical protein
MYFSLFFIVLSAGKRSFDRRKIKKVIDAQFLKAVIDFQAEPKRIRLGNGAINRLKTEAAAHAPKVTGLAADIGIGLQACGQDETAGRKQSLAIFVNWTTET